MESLQYNFLDNNFNFTTFENVERPSRTLKYDLFGDMKVDFDITSPTSPSGNPIATPVSDQSVFIHNKPEHTFSNNYNNSNSFSSSNSSDSLSFKELIEQEKLPIRITSGYRPNSKTKSGHTSYHSQKDSKDNPMAYDIVPLNGNFDDLLQKIYNNPRVVSWLKNNGYGVLEETTSDVMKKTGATGKHFHIGKDRWAKSMSEKRMKQFNLVQKGQYGFKVPFTTFEKVDIPENDVIHDYLNNYFNSSESLMNDIPSYRNTNTTNNNSENSNFIYNNPEYNNTKINTSSDNSSTKSTVVKDPSSAIQFFKSKGLTTEQAKGIIGNLYQESRFNTSAVGDRGKSFGLAQWRDSRLQGLINFANKKGTKKEDLQTQLEYIWEELNTTEKAALRALKSASNVEQATTVFMKYYERPGTPKLENRINFAKSL